MHYGDKEQIDNSVLVITVYNHEILGCKKKYLANGNFSKRYVDYQVTSIKKCENINPSTILRLLKDPYKLLNKYFSEKGLDPVTYEGFYEVILYTTNGYDLKISSVKNVTYDMSSPFNQLH